MMNRLKMHNRADLIPLWLNWESKIVLVVGLGEIGQRRALMFQRAGATIIGVDPLPQAQGQIWGELIRGGLELRAEPYDAMIFDELQRSESKPHLVLACANRDVNRIVVRDARSHGLWVASATMEETEAASCEFDFADAHLGASATGEFVRISVHSGNVAPALSKTLRDKIAETWLGAADRLAKEASHWRRKVMKVRSSPTEVRKFLLAAAGDPERLSMECREEGSGVADLRRIMIEFSDGSDESQPDQSRQP